MNEILRLDNVTLTIDNKEIVNTSFLINSGDFLIIKGANAVGKSLLLKLLYLKILPTKGNIFLFGKKIKETERDGILAYRKKLGVILQNDFLIPFFTVYQNIQLASQIQNKKDNFHKRIDEILEWLGLRKIKNDLVFKLSNGQKQRVVIARALINNPKIIIADQPDNNLDENASRKLFYLFESLNKLGVTVIMTSNFQRQFNVNYKEINL
tara:strand:+ start:1348 stop:1977 length:630 start_codon:yes stop_codon:yes gene_type:complete